MSDGSDAPRTGPVGEQAGRSGRPPVPRPVPSDPPPPAAAPDGAHRTERMPFPLPAPERTTPEEGAVGNGWHRTGQVPFPLPPLPQSGAGAVSGPETGRLTLGGYPPRVPGAARLRPGAPGPAPEVGADDHGGDRDSEQDGHQDGDVDGARHGR